VLSSLIRRKWPLPLLAVVVVVGIVGTALVAADTGGEKIVVYNGRSHYGDEQVFKDFEDETGIEVELRGGDAPALYERLRREGEDTPADILITTDLANLWRAKDAGLLQPVSTPTLQQNIPAALHDTDDEWWAISTRLRVPVYSTERIAAGAITSYDDLGDPKYKGRTCLRTSDSDYNQSLVADMLAKRGREKTEALLRSWMANDPKIINSDGEMLGVMAAGDCDLGLSNHYYLARALLEDADFPVAPAWPEQDGAGAHANVSGVGLVRWSAHRENAVKLMEYLTTPPAQREIVSRGEFAANPTVGPIDQFASWGNVKIDAIHVEQAGPLIHDAIELMLAVGWN
jgi:iron(III) transport system substrate-binding protein